MSARTPYGRAQLAAIACEISGRDLELLDWLNQFRLATTRQLARVTRPRYKNQTVALRQTHRGLKGLHERELLERTVRRRGGARAGSDGILWALNPAGIRLAALINEQAHDSSQPGNASASRRRPRPEPGDQFTEHSLAVTEARVQLHELQQQGLVTAVLVQGEPECWRSYLGPHAVVKTLRPDLAVTVQTADGYTDSWFVEIDRGTEAPARVIRKSQQYEQYRRTKQEQKTTGIFPAVAWVVPDAPRATQLRRHLAADPELPQGLFHVITAERFPELVKAGPGST
jgi:hypothetical protein